MVDSLPRLLSAGGLHISTTLSCTDQLLVPNLVHGLPFNHRIELLYYETGNRELVSSNLADFCAQALLGQLKASTFHCDNAKA